MAQITITTDVNLVYNVFLATQAGYYNGGNLSVLRGSTTTLQIPESGTFNEVYAVVCCEVSTIGSSDNPIATKDIKFKWYQDGVESINMHNIRSFMFLVKGDTTIECKLISRHWDKLLLGSNNFPLIAEEIDDVDIETQLTLNHEHRYGTIARSFHYCFLNSPSYGSTSSNFVGLGISIDQDTGHGEKTYTKKTTWSYSGWPACILVGDGEKVHHGKILALSIAPTSQIWNDSCYYFYFQWRNLNTNKSHVIRETVRISGPSYYIIDLDSGQILYSVKL